MTMGFFIFLRRVTFRVGRRHCHVLRRKSTILLIIKIIIVTKNIMIYHDVFFFRYLTTWYNLFTSITVVFRIIKVTSFFIEPFNNFIALKTPFVCGHCSLPLPIGCQYSMKCKMKSTFAERKPFSI